MKDESIWGIIYLCMAINQKAIQIYTRLSKAEMIKALKVFWVRMVAEEKIHALFWNRAKVAEKIRKAVEKSRPDGIAVTVSIGVEQGIIQNDSDKKFFSWISKADQYLYKAKTNGRNCVAQAC